MWTYWTVILSLSTATAIAQDGGDLVPYSSDAPQSTPSNVGPIIPDRTGLPSTVTISLTRPTTPYPTGNATDGTGRCKTVQVRDAKSNSERATAIKDTFLYAWDAYERYAFGFDELLPLTANGTNNRYGWGLTIVDSIDTAIIMGLTDVVERMLEFILKVDFTKPVTDDDSVQLFETNIRYIGGLLSAYDLLKSGQFSNDYHQQQVDALLQQAIRLTDKIAYGFNTATGLPAAFVNFTTNVPVPDTFTDDSTNRTYNSTNAASIGTFVLEFTRLSDLTGNQTYRELAERANSYLIRSDPAPVLPGLVGTQFDIDTGKMLTFNGGWQAGVDSFLEYLIKQYQYRATNTTREYREFWLSAVQSTIDNIALHPFGFEDLTFISRLDRNGSINYFQDDFSCFAGGSYLLGGALLGLPQLIDLGIATTDGCHHTYNQTATGLGPLAWRWYNDRNEAYDPDDNNDAAARRSAQRRGFYIPEGLGNWYSRPEPLESIFYAHRITGDPRWSEYAWEVFQAINTTARNNIAFAAVNNVDIEGGGTMANALDSFFFAEVLKYLYLTFTDSSIIDLSQWIFNTEAHPLLAPCAGSSSGYGRNT